jgi:hypothetical protein
MNHAKDIMSSPLCQLPEDKCEISETSMGQSSHSLRVNFCSYVYFPRYYENYWCFSVSQR